jgi:hypothetical protein
VLTFLPQGEGPAVPLLEVAALTIGKDQAPLGPLEHPPSLPCVLSNPSVITTVTITVLHTQAR